MSVKPTLIFSRAAGCTEEEIVPEHETKGFTSILMLTEELLVA